ncbi:MAG: nucleotidyltransferase family protein [Spirochaetes bacterium]|nr:nucleotidyltransferase family protein [Spirochaetota bacterium]MBN2770137.1 nucleotidyltransferase family protein [Spirochaetota bacterium]
MRPDNNTNNFDRRQNPSWLAAHLPRLNRSGSEDLFTLITAWLGNRLWSPSKNTDPKLLWNYIELHGLGGIAGKMTQLENIDCDYISDCGWERYLANTMHHARALKTCKRINDIANSKNYHVGIMKGPALAEHVYKDGGVRSYSDIDIYTDSKKTAQSLIEAVNGNTLTRSTNKHHRFGDTLKIDAKIDGWICEFTYPRNYSSDPMYDLINEYIDQIVCNNTNQTILNSVDPTIHMIYLILHMVIGHFYSRLIWFVDIEILYGEYKSKIDFDKIENILSKLQMANAAHYVLDFCKSNFESSIPQIALRGSNNKFSFHTTCLANKNIIHRRYSLDHIKKSRILNNYFLISFKFFLFADKTPLFGKNNAARWTTRRALNPFYIHNNIIFIFTKHCISLLFFITAKLFTLYEYFTNKLRIPFNNETISQTTKVS